MAIVFFGTPSFAVSSLSALIASQEDVSLVVTQPDRAQGRGRQVVFNPVKALALKNHIPVLQPESLRETQTQIARLDPEFLIVVAYGRILPQSLLDLPKMGSINVHASLLPQYRGAAPIQWALINGDTLTGVTTMLMDAGLDTGDILLKERVKINDDDNAMTLSERLSGVGARLLVRTIEGLRKGVIKPIAQPEGATYAPPIRREQGCINWQNTAQEIANLVRGLYIWPNAYCYLGSERIKIFKARVIEGSGIPGRIESISKGNLVVGTAEGLLLIEELQAEGKKRMPCRDFVSGRPIIVGNDYLS